MAEKLTLVILAAGMGNRYGGLKQFDAVGPGGETIMDYSVHDALRAGFRKVVVVIRRDCEEMFRERVAATFGKRTEVDFVFQELDALSEGFTVPSGRVKPWGTGHAILCAEPKVAGPFAVINADDFYGASAYQALARFLQAPGDTNMLSAAIVGYPLRNTLSAFGAVARGVCRCDGQGFLEGVEELTGVARDGEGVISAGERRLTGDEIVSMNLWGFPSALFGHLRSLFRRFLETRGDDPKAEFYIPSAVDALIRAGTMRVSVLKTEERWFGMTYREEKGMVVDHIARKIAGGAYPPKLWT